jgi:hypothetical protein
LLCRRYRDVVSSASRASTCADIMTFFLRA